MSIGISQSNYFPWIGFFELINGCDEFIFYDTVQYTKNDWRNRNILHVNGEKKWLTLPVHRPNGLKTKINEILVSDPYWAEKHFNLISNYYRNALYFNSNIEILKKLFEKISNQNFLSEINFQILEELCALFSINSKLIRDFEIVNSGDKNLNLVKIILSRGQMTYITSTGAKNYLDEKLFNQNNIIIKYLSFEKSVRISNKKYLDTDSNFSIIDTLMTCSVTSIKSLLHE
jgi:hypothetical protein